MSIIPTQRVEEDLGPLSIEVLLDRARRASAAYTAWRNALDERTAVLAELQARGLSHTAIARSIGLSQARISQLLSGASVDRPLAVEAVAT